MNVCPHSVGGGRGGGGSGCVNFICLTLEDRAPLPQLVEHRAVTREGVSSTPAGPTLRVFK